MSLATAAIDWRPELDAETREPIDRVTVLVKALSPKPDDDAVDDSAGDEHLLTDLVEDTSE
eukprot:jgi/Hompol1/5724/HPOL_004663-RA